MFNALTGLGWGVVTFAVTVGIGAIVLTRFSEAVAGCPTGMNYTDGTGLCNNNSNASHTQNPAQGALNTRYLNTQLGTTGLAGWAPAIIAFAVGMLFLGGFLVKKGRSRSY